MTKVFLREKKIGSSKVSLYLDYYPAITHPSTGRPTRREFLGFHVHEKPRSLIEREHNKNIRLLAEQIHASRVLAVAKADYGFLTDRVADASFLEHAEAFIERKKKRSTYRQWVSMLNHVKTYAGETVTFARVNREFCEGFREHLLYEAGLKRNSASQINNLFRSLVKKSVDKFKTNPLLDVQGITKKRTQRNYLELDELKALVIAECPIPILKTAGLFSSLTGLRFSDLRKLKWGEIRHSAEGFFIRFTQKKTDDAETLPVPDEAIDLLGERGSDESFVFADFQYWHCQVHLPVWLKNAGITRTFGFHSFRHTYAVLQLSGGTDLYTLSKMLGHADIQTTQIYARIVDKRKREAAGRISLR